MLTPDPNKTSFDVPWSFWPSADRVAIPQDPMQLLERGYVHRDVEIAAGVNRDEATAFVYMDYPQRLNADYLNKETHVIVKARGNGKDFLANASSELSTF